MQSVLDQNEVRKANALRQYENTMDSLHRQSEEAEGALVSLHSRLDTLQGGLEEALDNITLVAEHTSTNVAESPLQVVEVSAELDGREGSSSRDSNTCGETGREGSSSVGEAGRESSNAGGETSTDDSSSEGSARTDLAHTYLSKCCRKHQS